MNGTTDQRPASAEQQDQQDHGSPELALIVYAFLAAFAYLFATLSGVI